MDCKNVTDNKMSFLHLVMNHSCFVIKQNKNIKLIFPNKEP